MGAGGVRERRTGQVARGPEVWRCERAVGAGGTRKALGGRGDLKLHGRNRMRPWQGSLTAPGMRD